MCGIVGRVNCVMDGKARASVEKMCALIRRRGPDDDGFYFGDRVGLAMRRLAIIDVQSGRQPISNERNSIWIVFNGEIYNFQELQRDLERRGHQLKTRSDTECIVHLYEEYGDDCVSHLRGMFAFAIWDQPQQRLLLARDRLGIKPLYYWEFHGELAFASELKAILSIPGFDRKVDINSLSEYFTFGYVPCPGTIYEGVREMPPAHVGVWDRSGFRLKRYWQYESRPDLQKDLNTFQEELLHELEQAVRLHMISEVPLGAFLSGGIDSSAIVALMAKNSTQPVKSFTVGFRASEPRFDERQYAAEVARLFQADHAECLLDQQVESILPEIIQSFDEPFADSSMIPNYLVYQAAKKWVTVALSGLGGDELFAGYERYRGALWAEYYRSVPRPLRRGVIDAIVAMRHESADGNPWPDRLKRFVRSADMPLEKRYLDYISFYNEADRRVLFSPETLAEIDARRCGHNASYMGSFPKEGEPLDRLLAADMNTYLSDDLLRMTDRLSMWHSLEVRVPFLDHKFVEFVATIPAKYKLHWGKKKYVLIRALRDVLPPNVLKRRKQGFSIPLQSWLRGPLKDLVSQTLEEPALRKLGLFDCESIKLILNEHARGARNNETKIWALLVFVLWHKSYIDRRSD